MQDGEGAEIKFRTVLSVRDHGQVELDDLALVVCLEIDDVVFKAHLVGDPVIAFGGVNDACHLVALCWLRVRKHFTMCCDNFGLFSRVKLGQPVERVARFGNVPELGV